MPKYSKEERERRITEWKTKIIAAMKEHTVLHYTELNKLMGKREHVQVYDKGHYPAALADLIHNGKIVGVSHHALSIESPRRKPRATKTTVYYTMPAFAEVASWAKLGRKGLHSDAAILLRMDKIAKAHPKAWIHYYYSELSPSFMKEGFIRNKPYKRGAGSTKALEHKGKHRYVRTPKFNTAVKVLKKVFDHRGIPY